jgi:hypothetical protein
MTAQYNSAITQQPLLGADQYSAILGGFSQPTAGSFPAAQYPGAMIGDAARASLASNLSDNTNQANAANAVQWQRSYAPQAANLFNAQQQAQANTGLQAQQYANNQQQMGFQRQNAARDFGSSFLNQLFGFL